MVGDRGNAAADTAALRTQLQSLEGERDAWRQRRALLAERAEWIDRRQQQHARLAALASSAPEPNRTSEVIDAVVTDAAVTDAAVTNAATRAVKPSKREEIQELREKALQLLKTQQQVASKITSQLRTMAQDPRRDAGPGGHSQLASAAAASRSPSPPQEKSPSAAARRSNKLVLVPTTTTALGKRQLVPGPNAGPAVQYPTLTRTKDVPSDTTEELTAVAFRVATRHYLQTGETISRAVLRASVEAYVGRSMREDETCAIVEAPGSAMQILVRGSEEQPNDSPSLQDPQLLALSDACVHAWIDAEQSAVNELVSSWSASSPSAPRHSQLVGVLYAHSCTQGILRSLPRAPATVDALLSGLLGIGRLDDSTAVIETAFPHMTRLFESAQEWLDGAARSKETQGGGGLGGATLSGLRFDRPFDLEQESVLRQVQKSRKRQRADPMKVMCMYELSGACNDANCTFQHQCDYDAPDGPVEFSLVCGSKTPAHGGDATRGLVLPSPSKALMNQFVQLRESLRSRWPPLTEILNSKQPVRPPVVEGASEENSKVLAMHRTSLGDSVVENSTVTSMDWDEDFVELGSPLSSPDDDGPPASASLRYCQDENVRDAAGSSQHSTVSLEAHLAQHPEDIDAWLMLALRCLELEVSWSDENFVRIDETERLLAELEELHGLLRTSTHVLPSQDKVEHALHVLSRALEIEANAYCETLWLLHLRLSGLLKENCDIDGELQMTEQALSFVRTSVSLWRHFLTLQTSCFDKLDDSVATYRALLEAIAAASKQAKRRQVKDAFSVLLCDGVIQLCSLYCDAGRPADASAFLWSLMENRADGKAGHEDDDMNGDSGESDWRQEVHDQMIGDDILILYVLHVHVSLFAMVPVWLRERSFMVSEAINVYRLLLSSDALRFHASDCTEALRICQAAFKTYPNSNWIPPGIEVLRHNWIVIVATNDHLPLSERLEQLTTFADEELRRETLLPRVITVLATAFRDTFNKPDAYTKLMEELMGKYKTVSSTLPVNQVYQRFGEALHHYLLHQTHMFTADPLRTEFPTLKFMLMRLSAILPEKKPAYSKRTIKAILGEANWTVQRKSLIDLFTELVRDTLDHVIKCQLGEGDRDDSDEQDITQDTYYLAAQAQLLSQVCGPQAAIDVLDLVVIQGGSSQWAVLPRECRRIIWSVRFMLQPDVLKQESELSPSQELLQLLDRYLADVGPRSTDTSRVVKHQLAARLTMGAEEGTMPSLRGVIAFCAEYANGKASSAFDLALLRLCLAPTPPHERPNQFAVYQHRLGLSSSFWLSYAHTAVQDSDRRRVRSGLRRLVLENSRVLDAAALRLLVLLELQDKNVQAAALALGHRLRVNPLDSTAWGLISSLEVLFGEDSRARIAEITTKLRDTGGVRLQTRSIFGKDVSPVKMPTTASKLSHVQFAGLRLEQVPSTMATQLTDSLRVLDLSYNALVSLPPTVCRLANLQVLKLSGNSLVTLPPSIGQLVELQVVELAHNNLSAIPNAFWDGLVALKEIDLRSNALPSISPRVVRLKNLHVLRIAGNNIIWKDLEPIASKLLAACFVDIAPTGGRQTTIPTTQSDAVRVGIAVDTHAKTNSSQPDSPAKSKSSLVEAKEKEEDGDVPAIAQVAVSGRDNDEEREPVDSTEAQTVTKESRDEPDVNEAMAADTESGSKPAQEAIEIDDEEESKTDSSPMQEERAGGAESDDVVSVIDVEMTDTSDSAIPSAQMSPMPAPSPPSGSPTGDDRVNVKDDNAGGDDDDDDEIECLGSSLSTAAVPDGSPSNGTTTPLASTVNDPLQRAGSTGVSASPAMSAEMRRRVAAEIVWNSDYPRCSVCAAPNASGTHQRFNVSILCVACIVAAAERLREHGASR